VHVAKCKTTYTPGLGPLQCRGSEINCLLHVHWSRLTNILIFWWFSS
jgi:hypothetical protein